MSVNSEVSIHREIEQILSSDADPTRLLQQLIKIQHRFNHIPSVAIDHIHRASGFSASYIRSVIAFYSFLSLDSNIQYHVRLSNNFTDQMAHNRALFEQLHKRLEGLSSVSLGFTSCTGLCDQGPGLLINDRAINDLDEKRIDEIADCIIANRPLDRWPDHFFQIEDNIRRTDQQLELHEDENENKALHNALVLGADKIIELLEDSGLRGRGGAGFPTAKKWAFCQQQQAPSHYVVCNADEGEPGTFKDRVLLNSYADDVINGMTICARVIGAEQGFIYLRGEYRFLLEPLEERLQQRRADKLLGDNILGQDGFNFDIDIHLGAGAYICGEESALIESLEGKRGIPRIRPPFPVQQGYKNQPTVVNNVETFWSVSHILSQGAQWFKNAGTAQSSGTRLLSISGDCERPGIYEFPFGVSMTQILHECGGMHAQAIQMAGAAGHTVLARDFDRQLSFEDLATGGSFMVIGPQRKLVEMLDNFATFFKHESCGFCTPCRVGTTLIEQIIRRFKQARGSRIDLQQLESISNIMMKTSFCGLGSSAPSAFIDALKHNEALFESLMGPEPDAPAFDLEQEISEYQRITQSS